MGFEGRLFMNGNFKLPYRFFKPIGYDPAKKYPLVLFLHGGGQKGTDNYAPISHGIGLTGPGTIFTTAESQARWPVFLAAPQSPDGSWTGAAADAAIKMIAALQVEFPNIDAERLYITGLSLGGTGTWAALLKYPMMFAAGVPMAGVADTGQAPKIAKLPVWDFHSAMDENTNVGASRRMIAAMRAAGGKPCYTEYPTGNHVSTFLRSYQNPDLLPWMYAQHGGLPDQYGCVVSAMGTRPDIGDGGAPPDDAGGASGGDDAGAADSASGGGAAVTGSGGATATGAGGGAPGGSTGTVTGSGGASGGLASTGAGGGGAPGVAGGSSAGGSGCALAPASVASVSSLAPLSLLAALALLHRRRRRRGRD